MAEKTKKIKEKSRGAGKNQKYDINAPTYRQMVDEYLVNGRNQTRAYLKIFPDSVYTSAAVEASKVFNDPTIKKYVEECEKDVYANYKLTRERIAQELARLAFSDIRQLYDAKGNFKPIAELSDDAAAALSSVESIDDDGRGIGRIHKIRMHGKTGALSEAAKILGMFEKNNAQLADAIRAVIVPAKNPVHGKGK